VCVTETWLNAVYSDGLLDPKSAYHIYRCDRQSLHPSGGVCIFVSRQINSAEILIDFNDYPNVEIVSCKFFLLIIVLFLH